jgi:hypothetical protein
MVVAWTETSRYQLRVSKSRAGCGRVIGRLPPCLAIVCGSHFVNILGAFHSQQHVCHSVKISPRTTFWRPLRASSSSCSMDHPSALTVVDARLRRLGKPTEIRWRCCSCNNCQQARALHHGYLIAGAHICFEELQYEELQYKPGKMRRSPAVGVPHDGPLSRVGARLTPDGLFMVTYWRFCPCPSCERRRVSKGGFSIPPFFLPFSTLKFALQHARSYRRKG